MAQTPATYTAGDRMQGLIKATFGRADFQERIGRALMGVVDGAAFAEHCIIAANNPDIAKCTPESVIRTLQECATMGLTPGPWKLVALIPRKQGPTHELTVMPQWQGLKLLMERVPGVRRVTPVLVHVSDTFVWRGTGPHHEYDPFDPARVFKAPSQVGGSEAAADTGLVGGYAVIEYQSGHVDYHPVAAAKIHANRRCSQQANGGPWLQWFPEMCMKTILRDCWAKRAIAFDPCAIGASATATHLAAAERVDNAALGYSPAEPVQTIEHRPAPAEIRRGVPRPEEVGITMPGEPEPEPMTWEEEQALIRAEEADMNGGAA